MAVTQRITHDRPLAVGLVMAITLNAFEAVAVVTAMPAISADLHGDRLYGAAFSAYMLASLVSLVVSGEQADRWGPRPPFVFGAASFAAGLVVAGAAPTMGFLLAGRVLQGAGAGALSTVAYVAIGRVWEKDEQPGLFALLSAAWVLPALLAPLAAGWITENWGWRWVFFLLLPFVLACVLLALEPLDDLGPPDEFDDDMDADDVAGAPTYAQAGRSNGSSRLPLAALLAVGSGIAVAGLQIASLAPALVITAVGVALAGPALVRILPPGTLRAAPGIPAAVAARLCVNIAFFGTDSFIPLAAVRIHGATTLVAGAVIIGGSLLWSLGAQVSARSHDERHSAAAVRTGFLVLALGIVGTSLVVISTWPLGLTFLTWAVGGFGIGVVFNTTSSTAIAQAPPGREGLVSSQLGVADTLGFATIGAIGGSVIGAVDRTSLTLGYALTLVFALAALAALVGAKVAPRVRTV